MPTPLRTVAVLAACAASFPGFAPATEPARVPAPLPTPTKLFVEPPAFTLHGADAVQRLLVSGPAAGKGDTLFDLGRVAKYTTSDAKVATVTPDGVVVPVGNGTADIRVSHAGQTATVKAVVSGHAVEPTVSFRNQIQSIFAKHGCNSGGCHGKASGQNGFRLSLLGFDSAFDYNAVVKEARGRRVFPASPESSLLVTKAIGVVPHGGGKKLTVGTTEYDLLIRWIRQGTPAGSAKDPSVTKVEVFPKSRVVGRKGRRRRGSGRQRTRRRPRCLRFPRSRPGRRRRG